MNIKKRYTIDIGNQGMPVEMVQYLNAIGGGGNTVGGGGGAVREGCTDPTATNYDSRATRDDGSCLYPKYGCTDPSACNYNPTATVMDGSCDFTSCKETSPSGGASPQPPTDPNVDTYTDPTVDTTPTSEPAAKVGCMDTKAKNYDATATSPCESCCVFEKFGCMDSDALNYDSTATVACDSCCKYPDSKLADTGGGGFGGGFGAPSMGEEGEALPEPKKKSKFLKVLLLGTAIYVGYKMFIKK